MCVCLLKGKQEGRCSKEESAKGETAKEVSDNRVMGLGVYHVGPF